ncbi:MAG: hypothetical protein ACI89L_001514 [Phycisphaerales bacterium]|jgi:hypothetical protein
MRSRLISAVLPALIAAAALWTAGNVAQKAARQNESANWPTATGVVTESQVIPGGTAENLIHKYSFRCAYQTRMGNHEISSFTHFGTLGPYFRGGPAELAEIFAPGDIVTLHYSPKDHGVAVVGTGLTQAEMFSAGAIILALVAIGLASGLSALEPLLSPMVMYRPVVTSTTCNQFSRGPVEAKPRSFAQV